MEAEVIPGLNTNKVLALLEELKPERQQDGDVTVSAAMETWGLSKYLTTKRLEEFVHGGKFTKVDVILTNNRPGTVYRPKSE